MNDIQKELFTIYLETRKVCDQLNIKLIASGGTLLGAVRHKGFIPWDDDMDFYMLREDYDRFCKKGPKLINKGYFIQIYKTDKDWFRLFCKVRKNNSTAIEDPFSKVHQGIWIDIFPLDVVPENEKEYMSFVSKSKKMFNRINFHWMQERSSFKSKIKNVLLNYRLLIKFPFLNITYKRLEKKEKMYNESNSKFVGVFYFIVTRNYEKGLLYVCQKNFFNNLFEIPFENSKVTVFADYDKFLIHQYGDWHQIPPIEKRVIHSVLLYDSKKDYREYIKDKELMSKIRKKY